MSPSREIRTVRIDYEPGEASEWPNRHPCGAFVYVIEGSVRIGLKGQEPQVLHEGDSLYEPPGSLQSMSENASDHEPASLLAAFVVPD